MGNIPMISFTFRMGMPYASDARVKVKYFPALLVLVVHSLMTGFPFVLPNKIWMYDPQNRLSRRGTAPPQGVYRQPHDFLEKKIAARFLLDPGSRKSYINSIFTLGGSRLFY
jgi:hypothetical protein